KVIFTQGVDDGVSHTLYVDEVKVRDSGVSHPVSPPDALTATGYDRHIDLTWQASDDPDLEYYVIHRSLDGETFTPIGIQNPAFSRYADFLGESGVTAHYRITAVNHDYEESAP